ncbi:BMP family ABC transporter substrate-binding protein [Mycoplasmopsis gallinacea]|uniref:BMP family ABC transporter substrate-binding protein n=1 Tax=Mycoplasmopsis gallinacea TaxID=29556 RepID=A0A6H0V0W8_9BACT|nr:BMP family ABC transporter substrate-binding protein [Mycoplasmopsis gallinacea]QIW61990.1 BMP family ABC transporter substrate-binding protein [Mycoplasmopsis gallinacea]
MAKFKKTLLLGGLSLVSILPMVSVISCNDEDDITQYIAQKDRVTNISTSGENFSSADVTAAMKDLKPVLITDEGNVDDKSFNQSSWEALLTVYDKTKIPVSFVKPTNYANAYNAALLSHNKIWILSGFKHQKPIQKYIKENKAALQKEGVKIIGIDFSLDPSQLDGFTEFYGLNFKIKESAWIVGYATAKFLGDKYPTDAAKRLVTSFGGGEFPGVTTFNEGFLKGLLSFAKENQNKKVTHTDELSLDSGFLLDDAMATVVTKHISTNAEVILPVAGPGTFEVIKNNKTMSIIGVDVDQALSSPENAGRFLTSITKGIGQAAYDVITEIIFGNKARTRYLQNKQANSIISLEEGFKEGWVGYSPSHLKNEADREKMNAALREADAKFKSFDNAKVGYINSSKATEDGEDIASQAERLTALINAIKAA